MFKIEVFFIIIFGYGIIQWCNSHKIVETNEIDPDNESFEINDLSFTQGSNVLETIYASQTVGKSHRYHFIAGNRKTGDRGLARVFKQTGWAKETNVTVNIKYPTGNVAGATLTYIHLMVYQSSAQNNIAVIDGGIGQNAVSIGITANNTKYLTYNATFYGI